MEIFYDILNEFKKESSFGEIKRTRIQQKCNMSYDKFSKNLDELENRELISSNSSLQITDKGIQFLEDYGKINHFLDKMKLDYLSEESVLDET
ncbi:MAG: hypothetical protein HKM23_01440 [Nitrosopumilus sp.]|nr:hypothetical protein [Nitrosopumilus sp.]